MSAQNHLSPQQRGSAGEMAVRWRGPCVCKAPRAGPLPSGQNGAKTGALQFTSHQLLALHLLFIYCKAPTNLCLGQEEQLLLCSQSSRRGARLVPCSLLGPTEPGWSHTSTLSSLLFRQAWFRRKMRNQGPELSWSLRLLWLESTDVELLVVLLKNVGTSRIRPRGAPFSSSLPSLFPFWCRYTTCRKAASRRCRSAELQVEK